MRRKESSLTIGAMVTTSFAIIISLVALVTSLSLRDVVPAGDEYSTYVPTRLSVKSGFDTFPKMSSDSEKSWSTAIIGLLEAYYRNQGVSMGLLDGDEYIEFSEQALQEYIRVMNDGKDVMDGRSAVDFLKLARQGLDHIIPKVACDGSDECSVKALGDETILKFDLKGLHYATSISGIKELLHTYHRPLILSMPAIFADYYLPCTDDRVKETDACISKSYSIDGTFHGAVRTSTRLPSGQYFVPNPPAVPVFNGFDNFVLVGYNDDIHLHKGINQFSSIKASKGAFIVRGWTGTGNGQTIPLWEGRRTHYEDWSKCRSGSNPIMWVPYDFEGSIATELECIDADYCDTKKTYMLASYPNLTIKPSEQALVTEDSYGLTETIIYDKSDMSKIVFNKVPFWNLDTVFRSKNKADSEGSSICGYWTIPYELVEMAMSQASGYGNSVVAFDMPVKWARESYAKGMSGEAYKNLTASSQLLGYDVLRLYH